MKNENSDEKVTSINPVNQSQRAYCMQLAEALHKNNLITVAVDSEKCDVKTDVNCLQITKCNSCHTHLTLCTLSLYLHIKATRIDVESQSVHRMGNQWPQTFIMGKLPQRVVFLLPGGEGWTSCRVRTHLWHERVSCWSHTFYLLQWAFYVFFDYSKWICQWEMQALYRSVFLFIFSLCGMKN